MLVKFEPTDFVVDTAMLTPEPGVSYPARTDLVLSTNPADIAYVGTRVSGSLLAITGYDAGNYIMWRSLNRTVYWWKMDDATAVTTGIETIFTAANASTAAITLKSDGTLGS